jgi:CDP-glycerol glycerophosphotransferase (TagB/SpsB family)
LLVSRLAARMKWHPALRHHTLVVRLHPLDDPERWTAATLGIPQLRLSSPFDEATATDGWAMPSADDCARLTSSLAHADGCLNIASTISLDAAILDRPVICLDFTAEPDAPRDMLFGEYETEHYAPLVASGGLKVARTWAELLDLMARAISDPTRDRERRAAMVADACGPVDGKSAQRVARTLIKLAELRLLRGGGAIDAVPAHVTGDLDMVAEAQEAGRAR